jgi:hypothetical protein
MEGQRRRRWNMSWDPRKGHDVLTNVKHFLRDRCRNGSVYWIKVNLAYNKFPAILKIRAQSNITHATHNFVWSYLKEKVSAPVWKIENTTVGIRHVHHVTPSIRKIWLLLRRQAAVARSVEFARGLRQRIFFCYVTSAVNTASLKRVFDRYTTKSNHVQ